MKKVQLSHEAGKHAIIWAILGFSFFPLYVMLVISFKNNSQFIESHFLPTFPLHPENWVHGWNIVKGYIANSIFVAVLSVITMLITAIMGAFVFARYKFRGKTILWYLFLCLLFMPGIVNLVPEFIIMRELDLLNSLIGLAIVYTVGGQVFCMFVLRNFIEDIPEDLFEAAEVDGAGVIHQIRHIVLPMSGGILSALAIMRFLVSWNTFIPALVYINAEYKQLIPVGLMRLDGEYVKQWGEMMAGYSIAAVPLVIIFLFTMRLFAKGLTAGAVKG
ncbi:carbohydrate ABC transporter permease [Verrucomicrobiota bacterium]